ncbi:peptidoglycan editing factor PgeF [Ruminiclostridium cellobioparum]|uniref:peptidoglycan editing factor PgeF n=1 Tax=Ruminiclostridium cellobioparum TaxID=29355 RepID=UPI000558445C|nr:peptidoglycan editing factor PgeF [Ruminiclostridium cellobioparum]
MVESNDRIIVQKKSDLKFLEFRNLKTYQDILAHCFTTRLGGVSSGECTSLNLSFNRNDSRENVLANYRIIAGAMGVDFDRMVLSHQVHGNKIRYVGPEDAGKGLARESDIIGCDGLTTDVPGIPLVTFYADCVPVLMLDPVKKAITAVHSGWKGTLANISLEALRLMEERYKSNIEDLQVAVGPSICKNCFEVGAEVYELFINKYPWCDIYIDRCNEKYHMDLQQIIKRVLTDYGVQEKNILLSNTCTKCNSDVFFSYRGDLGKTGSLAAIMMLRETI